MIDELIVISNLRNNTVVVLEGLWKVTKLLARKDNVWDEISIWNLQNKTSTGIYLTFMFCMWDTVQ
jgi:hypothetical protein